MKKHSLAGFAAVLMLAVFIQTPAFAANELLVIDTAHIYAGMDKTYGQGYAPQTSAEEATVRMPLIVSQAYQGAVQGGAIMVTPDLGDPQTSPFIAGDLDQSVTLREYAVRDVDGQTLQQAFYIVLHLPLRAARINGQYPVVLHISYLDNQGLSIQQSFSVDVTITDGIDPAKNEGTVQSPSSQILLTNYEVNPAVVQAGQGFSVDFTMQNAGKKGAATDILISYNGETDDIRLRGSTGTVFVSRIEKDASQICHIEMDTRVDSKTGVHRIFVNIKYADETGSPASATFEIPVMIRQPVRLQYGPPNIPGQAVLGNNVAASLLISNAGMDAIYDVTVSLQSDGFIPQADTYLGNMESGSHKTASIIAQPTGESREVSGRFVVSYEDENGAQYTEEVPFESRILPDSMTYWKLPAPWAAIVAVLVAAAACVAVYLLYKTRKKEGKPE